MDNNALAQEPIPMLLHCPICTERHIDEGDFATKPHHTHACQSCGHVWRPAKVNTCGVDFLPGYRNTRQPAPAAGEVGQWRTCSIGSCQRHESRMYHPCRNTADMLERLVTQPTQQPGDQVERVARAIARANGDEFANAFKSKARWTAKRGMSGGRFRDVNEPFQSDYLEMARAALAAMPSGEVGQWLPIESAPRDTLCLLFEPHSEGGFCFVGCTDMDGEWVNNLDMRVQYPTLWKPLESPTPPAQGEG